MQDKITANYPVDEAAIRNLYRKLLAGRGKGDGEPRNPRFTEDADHGRRAPEKRARVSIPRGRSLDRNTHPV